LINSNLIKLQFAAAFLYSSIEGNEQAIILFATLPVRFTLLSAIVN
jgi:hypothetical protein